MQNNKIKNRLIPLSNPVLKGREWKYVKDCLDTGWVSSVGEYVTRFEEAVASYLDVKYAVAVVNGTSALHISLVACGVRHGDEVIVPALTFIATANAVTYCGASPIFMDCDIHSIGMDHDKLENFMKKRVVKGRDGGAYNKQTGRRIKAIIPVHVFGHPVDMEKVLKVCAEYGITVIEDAAESIGSEYRGKKTATLGDVGCLSFNGNKIITTGGGGMVVTDSKPVSSRVRHLTTQARSEAFEYNHDDIGYNYRLTNVLAAMGVAQMEQLDGFINIKRLNATLYRSLLSGINNVEFLWESPWARSNFWFYTLKVPAKSKNSLMSFLLDKSIQVRPVWKPMTSLPMYKKSQSYHIENAVTIYNTCINLPCSVDLRKDEIMRVADSIKMYFGKRGRA